jgi:hypothetical protein
MPAGLVTIRDPGRLSPSGDMWRGLILIAPRRFGYSASSFAAQSSHNQR